MGNSLIINHKQGFAQIENCILRNPYISTNARLVYGMLISYSFQKGSCFPGHDRLAEEMGMGKTSVRNALAELRGVGLIDWEQKGRNLPNVYHIFEEIPLYIKKTYSDLQFNLKLKLANPEGYKENKDEKKVLKLIHKEHEKKGRRFKKAVKKN